MKKLLIVSLAIGALFYFKPSLFSFDFSKGAFDENGNLEVLVFTQNNCGTWCDNGMKDLKRRGVPFTEIPIEGSKENMLYYNDMGGKGLPFFVMGNQKLAGYGKYQLATTLAQSFGDKYLTSREKRYYRNHFYDDDSPLIYVYGASWCPYCKKLREEFADRGIDYFELDVEKENDPQLIADTMGISGYPVVFVGYVRVKGGSDLIGNVMDATDIAGNRKF